MKLEQLQKIFSDATEEQLNQIKNFYQKDKDLIKSLQEENNSLTTRNTELTQNIKELEKNIEDLQNKLKEQEEHYKKEQEERQFKETFEEITNNKKFTNDIVKEAIFNKLKSVVDLPENKGKSYNEILENITKDTEGIFVNEQQEKITIPAVGNVSTTTDFDMKLAKAMGVDYKNN